MNGAVYNSAKRIICGEEDQGRITTASSGATSFKVEAIAILVSLRGWHTVTVAVSTPFLTIL